MRGGYLNVQTKTRKQGHGKMGCDASKRKKESGVGRNPQEGYWYQRSSLAMMIFPSSALRGNAEP